LGGGACPPPPPPQPPNPQSPRKYIANII